MFEVLQDLKTTDKTIQGATGFLQLLKDKTFLFWLQCFAELYRMSIYYTSKYNQDILMLIKLKMLWKIFIKVYQKGKKMPTHK